MANIDEVAAHVQGLFEPAPNSGPAGAIASVADYIQQLRIAFHEVTADSSNAAAAETQTRLDEALQKLQEAGAASPVP